MNLLTSISNLIKHNLNSVSTITYDTTLTFSNINNSFNTCRLCSDLSGEYIYIWNNTNAYRSSNSGSSFSTISFPPYSLLGTKQNPDYMSCDSTGRFVFAIFGTERAIYYSNNYGETFILSNNSVDGSNGTNTFSANAVPFIACTPFIFNSSIATQYNGLVVSSIGVGTTTRRFRLSATAHHAFSGVTGVGFNYNFASYTDLPENQPLTFRIIENGTTGGKIYYNTNTFFRTFTFTTQKNADYSVTMTPTSITPTTLANISSITKFDANESDGIDIIIITNNSVRLSTNSGTSFTNLTTSVPFSYFTSFTSCCISYNGRYVAVITGNDVIYSRDFGSTWNVSTLGVNLHDCEFSPHSTSLENILFVTSTTNGIYKITL